MLLLFTILIRSRLKLKILRYQRNIISHRLPYFCILSQNYASFVLWWSCGSVINGSYRSLWSHHSLLTLQIIWASSSTFFPIFGSIFRAQTNGFANWIDLSHLYHRRFNLGGIMIILIYWWLRLLDTLRWVLLHSFGAKSPRTLNHLSLFTAHGLKLIALDGWANWLIGLNFASGKKHWVYVI